MACAGGAIAVFSVCSKAFDGLVAIGLGLTIAFTGTGLIIALAANFSGFGAVPVAMLGVRTFGA